MRKLIIILSLIGLVVFSSGCGMVVVGDWNFMTYNGSWAQDFDFSGNQVTIEGANGNITVIVSDNPKVEVTANWSAKVDNYEFRPVISQDEDSFSIARDRNDRDLSGTNFIVTVPKGIKLDLRTSNGRVSVNGEALESLKVDTSNGAVMVDNAGSGMLIVDTSNGLARISGWRGQINCATSNGAITAILPQLDSDNYVFTTSNGGISITVAPSSSFEISANTSNGSIRSSLPGNWSEAPSGTKYSGSYNGGGASITLRTSNSNIQLLPGN